eukprot:gnl/Chilomastix_caulleri/791.p1 GENE.gnl/Chilomastix_caulleri/791~~gnl/Chilomastix_caulleri/791.p1  ORF type:complete len:256 (+),score=40.90 gnl/Chilomastix_caulleri/791:208-975(+)
MSMLCFEENKMENNIDLAGINKDLRNVVYHNKLNAEGIANIRKNNAIYTSVFAVFMLMCIASEFVCFAGGIAMLFSLLITSSNYYFYRPSKELRIVSSRIDNIGKQITTAFTVSTALNLGMGITACIVSGWEICLTMAVVHSMTFFQFGFIFKLCNEYTNLIESNQSDTTPTLICCGDNDCDEKTKNVSRRKCAKLHSSSSCSSSSNVQRSRIVRRKPIRLGGRMQLMPFTNSNGQMDIERHHDVEGVFADGNLC